MNKYNHNEVMTDNDNDYMSAVFLIAVVMIIMILMFIMTIFPIVMIIMILRSIHLLVWIGPMSEQDFYNLGVALDFDLFF